MQVTDLMHELETASIYPDVEWIVVDVNGDIITQAVTHQAPAMINALRGYRNAAAVFQFTDAEGRCLDSQGWRAENLNLQSAMSAPLLKNGEVVALLVAQHGDPDDFRRLGNQMAEACNGADALRKELNDVRVAWEAAEERARLLKDALMKIADWANISANNYCEATGSYAGFDEPKSVQIAREVLSNT